MVARVARNFGVSDSAFYVDTVRLINVCIIIKIGYHYKKFASSEFVSMNLAKFPVHRLSSISFF